VLFALATASPASAWGARGHRLISQAAALAFPSTLPAFVRSPAAVAEIAALGPELDRLKGAGESWDRDRDPGHYVDIGDDGKIAGVVALDQLPRDRETYDRALRDGDSDQYRSGFLPYTLIDGWQQLAKDFAIWRIDRLGETRARDPHERAAFAADRALQEVLVVRDIGVWSHFVGDASQPLHTTIHYDGWGDYPNPQDFPTARGLHAAFETEFVRAHASEAAVRSALAPLAHSDLPIADQVGAYLRATNREVLPLYDLAKQDAFARGSPAAIAFVDARLAAGASELRDLVADAWDASAAEKVGYPVGVSAEELEREPSSLPPLSVAEPGD
ncbi:MAG: S1/P1 Nuclease, partial [Vulcanimicrobiaceae bacterium]